LISPDQMGQLDELNRQLYEAQNALGDLNTVYSSWGETTEETAVKAGAAWDKYAAIRDRNLQSTYDAIDAAQRESGQLDDLGNAASDAGGGVDEATPALKAFAAEEAKAKAADDPMKAMTTSASAANTELVTMRGLLTEIVALAGQVSL